LERAISLYYITESGVKALNIWADGLYWLDWLCVLRSG
jgi:hypothetical protein